MQKIHNIQEKDKIYALIVETHTSKWSFVPEELKEKTILYFSKKKCSIIFYYIKEGLKGSYFTLSVFEREDPLQKEKVKLSLFLSPFMRSAMQLGPYIRKGKHSPVQLKDLQDSGVEPSLYTYSMNSTNERFSYSQVEKYYSEFYVDPNIIENTD